MLSLLQVRWNLKGVTSRHLGNNRPNDRPTTDRLGHIEITLPIIDRSLLVHLFHGLAMFLVFPVYIVFYAYSLAGSGKRITSLFTLPPIHRLDQNPEGVGGGEINPKLLCWRHNINILSRHPKTTTRRYYLFPLS